MIWPHGLALLGLVCFAQLFPAQWPVFYDWETCIDLAYRLIPSKMSNVRIEAWEQDKALETKEEGGGGEEPDPICPYIGHL